MKKTSFSTWAFWTVLVLVAGFLYTVSRSLHEQVELIDGMWNELSAQQQEGILAMYAEYKTVMDRWSIPNIKDAAAQ